MTKGELIEHVARQSLSCPPETVETIFNAVLEGVTAALAQGDRIELRGFGSFAVRERPARAAIWAIIVCNALWTAASVLLLVGHWIAPTALGYAFVIGQALIVAVFGGLQYAGLQRQIAA